VHHDQPGPDRSVPDLPLADELSAVFARVAGLLLSEETVATALGLVSSMALDTVPGAVGAGISIMEERGRRSSGPPTPGSSAPTPSSTSWTRGPAWPRPRAARWSAWTT
jgi:hypothetical protein